MDHQHHGRRVSRPDGGEGQAQRQPLIRTATATRSLLPQSGPRTRWASDYRAFRTADRLWNRFYEPMRHLSGVGVPSWVMSAPLPLGLDGYGRLRGDLLGQINYRYARMGADCALTHHCRMTELRRSVRLPR